MVRAEPSAASLDDHQRDLFQTLVMSIADAERRRRFGREIDLRERALAVSEERARVAWDLHETVAGFMRAIETTATRLVESTSGSAREDAALVASLSRSGRRELEDAVRMAAPLAFDPRSLEATVGSTVEKLGELLGTAADLQVRGRPRPLSIDVQKLLLRIAFETLHRVERGGRASGVAVELHFSEGAVGMAIRDDGIDLGGRETADALGAHFGLRVVQRRVEEAGGVLVVEHRPRRGLVVRATVPA
jgi:two-component system sensor histidine kinase DegS